MLGGVGVRLVEMVDFNLTDQFTKTLNNLCWGVVHVSGFPPLNERV